MSGRCPRGQNAQGRCLLRVDWHEPTQALATAEAQALGGRPGPGPGLFWFDALPPAGRAAFVLVGGEVVASGPPGGPVTPLVPEAAEVQVPKGPWRPPGPTPLDSLAQLGWRARYLPSNHPGPAFTLYPTLAGWWLVRSPGSLRWTEPALLHRTSTSLPSRLARAVVNLVARPGDRVADPVCGTGVLLVEAARLGCSVRGGDTSAKAVWWARHNLAALGLAGEVEVRDALAGGEGDVAFDAAVGDLPYGMGLVAQELGPFAAALARLGRRWAFVAPADLRAELEPRGVRVRQVIEVPKLTFTRYVHVGDQREAEG